MHETDSTRRALLRALGMATVVAGLPGCATRAAQVDTAGAAFADLERSAGGRLGVFALDTGSGRTTGLRADERFGLCSTFKLPLAAAVLREADAGRLSLDTVIAYSADDMVPHAPVTQRHLAAGGMTIEALAEAAQTTSDNVAANLLIARLGGPQRVTALFRAMGDPQTRLDRYETQMNFVPPGEVRDTTTPRAMTTGVAKIMTGTVLSAESRARLQRWMIATETGKRRLRAGLPTDWIAGDKTGTALAAGMPNKHNDVAVIWPPQRAPVVVAAYYEAPGEFDTMRAQDDAVLAQAGRIVAGWIGESG
jgi:beta-lactamase class A